MRIHLIPGVAADHRLFARLALGEHEKHHLELPEMPAGSTIRQYAEKLAGGIDGAEPHVLIGVSMGGMIAQELAALARPLLVIIISSWKGPDEMPAALRALRGTHPERVLSAKFIERIRPLLYWQMGAENDEDRELVDSFIKSNSIDRLKAQLDASLNWNGPGKPVEKLVHIHGENDHLMPINDVKDAIGVKDGGHFMVFNKAEEIGAMIGSNLNKLS